jgi:hypothetical protein
VYKVSHLKGGAVPPTDPVGLDPTKPGEATASAQQLLPGEIGADGWPKLELLQPYMKDIPYPSSD